MSDLERLLSESLKSAGDAYGPADHAAARERFLRRRRRRRWTIFTGSAAATATAVLAALVLVSPTSEGPPSEPVVDVVAERLGVTMEIPVGEAPSGIALGDDGVWTADSGSGTVSKIDPATDEVMQTFEVGGRPDDVVMFEDTAWVADPSSGSVTPVVDDTVGVPHALAEAGRHLDVAVTEEALWVVAKNDALYRMDPATRAVETVPSMERPTDVSVGEGAVWVLGHARDGDQPSPLLVRIDADGATTGFPLDDLVPDADLSGNTDLAVGGGSVWIAYGSEGRVVRLDAEEPRVTASHHVGGTYTGISIHRGLAWAVTGGFEGDQGVVTRYDVETGEEVGEPLFVTGRPFDIVAGRTGIWLTGNSDATVKRLAPAEDPQPQPSPDPDDAAFGVDPEDIVFVYSFDGDIWAETTDGEAIRLTETTEREERPTYAPDGRAVAFERRAQEGTPATIVHLDLDTGHEEELVAGEWPAFGPDGRLAWIEDNPHEARIVYGGAFSEPQGRVIAEPGSADPESPDFRGPSRARHLSWGPVGDFLYYQAGWEEAQTTYQLAVDTPDAEPFPLSTEASGVDEGAVAWAPSAVVEDGVHVLVYCCSGGADDSYESVSLGKIAFTEGGPELQEEFTLGSDYVVFEPILVHAGDLAMEADDLTNDIPYGQRRWVRGGQDTWFFGTTGGYFGSLGGFRLVGDGISDIHVGADLAYELGRDLPPKRRSLVGLAVNPGWAPGE